MRHETYPTQTASSSALAIAGAFALAMAIAWPNAAAIWTSGAFHDPDDAARMSQVRDFLAGQSWYDLRLHRLGTPDAPDMHWSRFVDAPIALLVRAFEIALAPAQAERVARIAFPALLFLGLLAAGARLASHLSGRNARTPALILLAMSGLTLGQFQPGRVDHHAPQILLLVTALLLFVRALDPTRAFANAAGSAALLAVSLGISLENMPAAAALSAVAVLLHAFDPEMRAGALRGFAAGWLIAGPLVLAVNLRPSLWLRPVCDSYSIAHLTVATAGALACLALSVAGGWLATRRARLAAAAALGVALAAGLFLVAPSCLTDPYSGIDPLVRGVWLDHVGEARSLLGALRTAPSATLAFLIPCAIGMAGAAYAIARAPAQRRPALASVGAVALAAFAVACWRIGAISHVLTLSAFGAAAALAGWPRWRVPGALACSGLVAGLALGGDAPPRGPDCVEPAGFARLAGLPPGVVLAPIEEGAHLIAETPHRVLAGPYHRNNAGNRIAAQSFMREAADALAAVRTSGADYLVFCHADTPLARHLAQAPAEGLTRIAADGPRQIYRIAK